MRETIDRFCIPEASEKAFRISEKHLTFVADFLGLATIFGMGYAAMWLLP